MKFIELYGIPGSGKSYLVELLEKNKKNFFKKIIFIHFRSKSLFSITRKFSLIFLIFPFNLFTTNFYRVIKFYIYIYKPINSKKISFRTMSIFFNTLYLLSVIRVFKILRNNLVVIDQGFFQLFWSISYEMNCAKKSSNEILIKKWHDILTSLDIDHHIYNCFSSSTESVDVGCLVVIKSSGVGL